mgnify:CR=1 FL=1
MSGSGDHLPERLRQELAAILAPMKAAAPGAVDLRVDAPLTIYPTAVACPTLAAPTRMATAVSGDALTALHGAATAMEAGHIPLGFESIDLYQHTGTEGTSRLVWYMDSATGLPLTISDGTVNVTWDAAGIFSL